MNDFSFHPEAEADLNEIWDFIADDSVDAADRVRDPDHFAIGTSVSSTRQAAYASASRTSSSSR
jgi:hypothetical protein